MSHPYCIIFISTVFCTLLTISISIQNRIGFTLNEHISNFDKKTVKYLMSVKELFVGCCYAEEEAVLHEHIHFNKTLLALLATRNASYQYFFSIRWNEQAKQCLCCIHIFSKVIIATLPIQCVSGAEIFSGISIKFKLQYISIVRSCFMSLMEQIWSTSQHATHSLL